MERRTCTALRPNALGQQRRSRFTRMKWGAPIHGLNEQKPKWFEEPGQTYKLPEDVRRRVFRERNGAQEFLPENWELNASTVAGIRARDSQNSDDAWGGNEFSSLPFLRNKIQRPYNVAAILGEPPNTTPTRTVAPSDTPQHLQGSHLGTVRPYDTQQRQGGDGSNNHQAYIGTFLNAYAALDGANWDTEALLRDVECPKPPTVLRHLTSLIDTQCIYPRRLSDTELAPLLRRCSAGEVRDVWGLAVERHAPGMLCLKHAAQLVGAVEEA
eukprot:Hpha_TRINITY_DN11465_c0_g2::TRINITY_DN11465_c0_g2_i2::g.137612::m.137612